MSNRAVQLIDANGGDTALAKKLGLPTPSGARRVHNWRSRGIPTRMQLDFPELFLLPPSPAASTDPTGTKAPPEVISMQNARKEAA